MFTDDDSKSIAMEHKANKIAFFVRFTFRINAYKDDMGFTRIRPKPPTAAQV